MRSSVRSLVLLEAAELSAGESVYLDCPACGDTHGKFSVTVTDDGLVLYNCFRASCSLNGGGAVAPNGVRDLVRTREPRTQRIRPYTGLIEALPVEEIEMLAEEVGFDEQHILESRAMWAPEERRVAYPILGPMGRRRGFVLRSYRGSTPKALTRTDTNEPHLSYYGVGKGGPTLVVEDIPSAIRAARYCPSVALSGTGCGPDYASEIAAHAPEVVWALDADATSHAVALQRRHALLFNQSRVATLPCDLKDMEEDELCNFITDLQ